MQKYFMTTLSGALVGNVTGDLTGNITATSVITDGVTATTQNLETIQIK